MKKRFTLHLCGIIGLVMLYTGCVTTDGRLMNKAVGAADHAALYFSSELTGASIDGDNIKINLGGLFWGRSIIVLVTPGVHTVTANYLDEDPGSSGGLSTTTFAEGMSISHDFLSGHYYFIRGIEARSMIHLEITDETDPSVLDRRFQNSAKRRIAAAEKFKRSAKYPEQPAYSLTYNNLLSDAKAAVPTQFEGTWAGTKRTYHFQGNSYEVFDTEEGDLRLRDMYNGVFEFTDTTLVLTPLQKLDLFSARNLNIEAVKLEYTYTLNGDQLVLLLENEPVDTFVKTND